jgi:VanZ family protein
MNRILLWLCVAFWAGVLAWGATIFYLSSLSGPQLHDMAPILMWDKFLHFIAFVAGGLLLAGALRFTVNWTWPKIFVVTVLALSFLGMSDEYHQLNTPKRSGADVGDWIADTLGACAGAAIFCLTYVRYPRKDRPAPATN